MTPAAFCAAVRETIRRRGMDDFSSGPILVAVSGGADSMALMHVLHRLGYAVEVAHFDHRVRAGSDRDATFVAGQAAKMRLAFHLGINDDPPRRGDSPEQGMRRARLGFLEHTASVIGAPRIATGHTKDDQAETVMMRVVTGAGRRGLSGIPPVRGPYIRPLIDRTREETHAFCRSLRLAPRRDPTNNDPAYLRNAVRADLLPMINASYNGRIAASLARTADVLRDEDDLLDSIAADAIEPTAAAGSLRLEVGALRALHPAIQRRALRRIARLDADQTERVRRLALDGATGDQLFLPEGLNARLEYGFLVLGPAPSSPARTETVPLEVPGTTQLPGWGARLRAVVTRSRPSPLPDGIDACAVDAAAAGGPLVVRRPKPGDRFRPLGMKGAKKLGDYFIDQKVPRSERAATPVIAAPDGIVWVVGHRVDDRAKVAASTKRVLVMEWDRTDEGRGTG